MSQHAAQHPICLWQASTLRPQISYDRPRYPSGLLHTISGGADQIPASTNWRETERREQLSPHAKVHRSTTAIWEEHPTLHGIEIEVLHGIAQAHEVEKLQMDIWSGNDAWIVPSHALLIVSDYGGILLGARIDSTLVGFVLGFLARSAGKLFHASHMLGVLPTSERRGIGAVLKLRQREIALQQGLDLMRWTFDPLEARNAYFNLHKLGTVCRLYRPDYYGPMQDALNRDLPSDRLLVEWHLDDTEATVEPDVALQTILHDRAGLPELQLDNIQANLPVTIEIPRDLQVIKRDAPDVALLWRMAVRQAFSMSFDKGYVARDFRDGAYVLMPQKEPGNEN